MTRHVASCVIALFVFLGACSSAPPEEVEEYEQEGTGGAAGQAGALSASGGSKADAASPRADAAVGGSKGTGGPAAPKPDSGGAGNARPSLGDTNAQGLKLVWAEEFDGPEIDRAIWHSEIRQGYNNEEEYLTDSPDNQFIDNGNLVIRGIPSTQYAGANYTSAFLTTQGKKFYKYGYFEARMKMPMAQGCWPAFWMLPQEKVYGGWPLSGEIDIMEYWRYDTNKFWGTANYDDGGYKFSQGGIDIKVDPADYFHVLAIRWTEAKIEWYADGVRYYVFDLTQPIAGRRPFNESFYLIVNLAIGGTRGGLPGPEQWPDDLRTDWVRVWQ